MMAGMAQAHASHLVTIVRDAQLRVQRDEVAVEEPLEIRARFGGGTAPDRAVAITMRTPGDDAALAVGFLVGEGMLRAREDLLAIEPQADANVLTLVLAAGLADRLPATERHFYRTSSCGVCGKGSIAALQAVPFAQAVASRPLPAATLLSLAAQLGGAQPVFARTGGLHASALFTFAGELVAIAEDIGRHNALDKLIGAQWLAGSLPLGDHVLLLSGRASFELLQKAMAGGIPVVAALGAPSSLAIDLAQAAGITLAGFVKSAGCNLYSHAGRIAEPGP